MVPEKEKSTGLFDNLKEYLALKGRIISLTVTEKTAETAAKTITRSIIILLISLSLFFGSFALAFVLGTWLGHYGWGFLIVGGVFLSAAIVTSAVKADIIEPRLTDMFVGIILEITEENTKIDNGEKDKDTE